MLHSRPFFLSAVSRVPNYRERTRMEKITRHIPRADAKWLGQRLSMLTDDQIRDGFRAAGYDAARRRDPDEDHPRADCRARGAVITRAAPRRRTGGGGGPS